MSTEVLTPTATAGNGSAAHIGTTEYRRIDLHILCAVRRETVADHKASNDDIAARVTEQTGRRTSPRYVAWLREITRQLDLVDHSEHPRIRLGGQQ
jgi:hypothetical protein